MLEEIEKLILENYSKLEAKKTAPSKEEREPAEV